ncbi:TRAP transporter small permease [Pseudodonghicola flavimaris]|uniref:TRAP transporter small permease protein n=1 Tax=Pseudodonghicola flavimaris TaxID=3050036 RepID=A0ABT7F2J9_9RHOB|nr:TRAP transporter small permease subunit [Pseudodonghicola flavimaris]MDK3018823.1 TRAP transporter small permease subunit [Pseudodonghicola flavimaris]
MTQILARSLALLGFTGLLILSILVVLDIILRTVADYPLKGVNDISAMVMAVVISACIPQSLLIKQSISVDVLGQFLGGRAELLLNAVASLAVLVFFGLLAWQFVPYAASVSASGERTWVLQWPVGPWWYVATGCFIVSALTQAMVLIDDIISVALGRPWAAGSTPIDGSL